MRYFSFLFFIVFLFVSQLSFAQSSDKELMEIIKGMNPDEKAEVKEFLEHLIDYRSINDEVKVERQMKLDSTIPNEETIAKIQAYSQYLIYKQKRSADDTTPEFDGELTYMYFFGQEHKFDKIKAGKKVSNVFKFQNTGKNPLQILDVKTTCGCTVIDWDDEPIKSGGTGEITVIFDSTGKSGKQYHVINVVANTKPHENLLFMIGEVEEE